MLLLCTAIVVTPSSSDIITRCMNVDIHQPVDHIGVPGTRKIDSPTHTFHTGGKTKNDQMVWFFRSQTSPHMSSRQSIPSAWTNKSPSHSIPVLALMTVASFEIESSQQQQSATVKPASKHRIIVPCVWPQQTPDDIKLFTENLLWSQG